MWSVGSGVISSNDLLLRVIAPLDDGISPTFSDVISAAAALEVAIRRCSVDIAGFPFLFFERTVSI